LPQHEALGEYVTNQMMYYPTVTREVFKNQGRITAVLDNGQLTRDLGLPDLDPAHDRIMICVSLGLNTDMRTILDAKGFKEGNTTTPGDYVVESAFVDS
jgi:ferredoxin/flavodoxin---NADP+ reductase